MRVTSSKFWTIVTIALSILTGVLVYRYLSNLNRADTDQAMATIVVTRTRVSQGTRITPEMIKTVQVPVKYAHPMAISDPKNVIDHYATVDLWPEEPILAGQVASGKTGKELPYKIPEGTRAVTIAVDPVTGVGGHIKPGHYVDVLVSYQASERLEDIRVSTILQKVLVIAVGEDLEKKEGVQPAENITLAVTPEDSQLLTLAESIGRLKLVLRPAGDRSEVRLPTVDQRMLLIQP